MNPSSLLELIFRPNAPFSGDDLRAFLRGVSLDASARSSSFGCLAHLSVQADDRLTAAAAGHQSAVRRLFPETPDVAITAFCVSEDQGPRPSGIQSTLTRTGDRFILNGSKKRASLSPLADILYVAASIGSKDGRNQLRMAKVAADSPGLAVDPSPYAAFHGHMPIADLHMADIELAADAVFPLDAYEAFIKPFRLVEDVYGASATQIALLRLGCVHNWPQDILEDLIALIVQAYAISETAMNRQEEVVLMSAYFRASDVLWRRLTPCWERLPTFDRARWRPEAGPFDLGARARATRRRNAWAALSVRD